LNLTTPPGSHRVNNRRGIVFQLAAVALVVVSALAATGLARYVPAARWLPTRVSRRFARGCAITDARLSLPTC